MTNENKIASKGFDAELYNKLKLLIYSRLVFITILFAATYFIGLRDNELLLGISIVYLFILIGSTMIATLAFVLVLFAVGKQRQDRLVIMSYAQIFWDITFASAVVYITGGVESIFFVLYYVNIFLASILLFRKGGFIAASASSILYGLILVLQVHEIIPPFLEQGFEIGSLNETHVLAKIVINFIFFFFLAWISGVFTDRLRRAQALLKEKDIDIKSLEDFNRSIVESLKSGLLTVDGSNRVISFNPAAQKILGLKEEEILNAPLGEVMPDLNEADPDDAPKQAGKKRSFWMHEIEIPRKERGKLFIGLNMTPFKVNEAVKDGKVIIFEDLTNFKEMESRVKRSEKLAAIGELAAGIAHEIRNPLASISGAIEMLKQEAAQLEGKSRLMDIVTRETTRLNYLISDFLNFAKSPKLSREVFNINALIGETVELFLKSRSDWNGTKIKTSFSTNIYVSADPQQIKQVVWNLLKNAAQAMPDGGNIEIKTELKDGSGEFSITVADEGEGILPEDITRIFSPFYTTKRGGTGLGLATVHKIVEEHGGRITVDSTPGVGTKFTVYLQVN